MQQEVQVARDDRIWAMTLPASDIVDLMLAPHEFVHDNANKTLTDAFTIQFIERTAAQAGLVGNYCLAAGPDEFVLSGINNTGILVLEGPTDDVDIKAPAFPTMTALESAFVKVGDDRYVGCLHVDVRGSLRNAAHAMFMAIRHRTKLAELIGSVRWQQRILDDQSNVLREREEVKYNVTFADAPIILAHGTMLTYPLSCHVKPGYIETDLDLAEDVEFDSLDLILTGMILKAN